MKRTNSMAHSQKITKHFRAQKRKQPVPRSAGQEAWNARCPNVKQESNMFRYQKEQKYKPMSERNAS